MVGWRGTTRVVWDSDVLWRVRRMVGSHCLHTCNARAACHLPFAPLLPALLHLLRTPGLRILPCCTCQDHLTTLPFSHFLSFIPLYYNRCSAVPSPPARSSFLPPPTCLPPPPPSPPPSPFPPARAPTPFPFFPLPPSPSCCPLFTFASALYLLTHFAHTLPPSLPSPAVPWTVGGWGFGRWTFTHGQ